MGSLIVRPATDAEVKAWESRVLGALPGDAKREAHFLFDPPPDFPSSIGISLLSHHGRQMAQRIKSLEEIIDGLPRS